MGEITTDCRSETGVTVGLVDSLITIARVLRTRDLSAPAVVEALKDLAADEDLAQVLATADLYAERAWKAVPIVAPPYAKAGGWARLTHPNLRCVQIPAAPICADLGEPPEENGQLLDTLAYSARRLDITFF